MKAYTAIVEDMKYYEMIDIPVQTPLGTAIQTVVADNIVVTFSIPEFVESHTLHLRPEAIGNRRAAYDLEHEILALEALVRELIFGWAPELTPDDPSNPVHTNGGIDERIDVTWTDDALLKARDIISQHQDRINASYNRSQVL